MATSTMPEMADIERGQGIEPLDILLAELDATEAEWSAGWALYGTGGLLDDLRKALLDTTAMEIKEMAVKNGLKLTDGMMDTMAHADEHYRQFLDEHVIRRAEWITLDVKRKKIEMRFRRGNGLLNSSSRGV